MIVVTGTPRSGTSLAMLSLAKLIGKDKIVGDKFPQKKKAQNAAERYVYELKNNNNLNPTGFWENLKYISNGFSYSSENEKEFYKLSTSSDHAVKIIATGLPKTEPKYIDKLVICLRDPLETATSQTGLVGQIGPSEADPKKQIFDLITIAKYMIVNPKVDYFLLNYSDHKINAKYTMEQLSAFVEVPYKESIYKATGKKTMKRPDTKIWDEAFYIYNLMIQENFQAVCDYSNDVTTELSRQTKSWFCPKFDFLTNDDRCNTCRSNSKVRENFIKKANHNKHDHENEPCYLDLLEQE